MRRSCSAQDGARARTAVGDAGAVKPRPANRVASAARPVVMAQQMPERGEWGSIAMGGPIVTAGGLVFTAGSSTRRSTPLMSRLQTAVEGHAADERARDADDLSGGRWTAVCRDRRRRPRIPKACARGLSRRVRAADQTQVNMTPCRWSFSRLLCPDRNRRAAACAGFAGAH